jgi:hypothetical protein
VRTWLAGGAVAAIAVLSLCAGARAKEFRVYTCTILDERREQRQPLGPTIGSANARSGWEFVWSGLVPTRVADGCPGGDAFTFEALAGGRMAAGQGIWARWTTAPGTELTSLNVTWWAESDTYVSLGNGTARLTAATDQQILLAQDTPLSVSFGFPGTPPFQPPVLPAHWFEFRYTCLDQCSTGPYRALYANVLSAQFDVEDRSAPTGGVTGSATDAQTWSGLMRFGLNAGDVGGGLFRAVVELDGADVLAVPLGDSAGACRDIGPDPALNEFAAAQPCPLRIDNGSLDVDTAKLPSGQHAVRILLEDAAGNRTTIFGPLTRTITTSGSIGAWLRSRAARSRQWRRCQRPGRAHRALGPAR